MPKREPTPPLEDDYKYLVISYPFPLHADVKINADSQDLAHWIASCIGKDCLTAIYHKPSAPNMVIIEVIKTCPRMNALLGAHKWREFLRRPESDQVDNESRIYYCRYSSGREVQKCGWKRLDVWDDWFDSFDPINGPFVCNPYPKTTFCEVPPETQTEYSLCRPLPTDLFPRPKSNARPAIVPGSGKYVHDKETSLHPIAAPIPVKQPTKSWASVISSGSGSAINTSTRKTGVDTVSRTTSQTSSEDSASLKSPIDGHGVLGAPPGLGLGPPPGLLAPSMNLSQISSESGTGTGTGAGAGWDFEPPSLSSPSRMTAASSRTGKPSVEIITSGFAVASIEDPDQQKTYYNNRSAYNDKDKDDAKQNKENDDEEKDDVDVDVDVDYWAERPAHPRDWDKPLCPVHQTSCRAGICEVMYEIEKEKKKRAEAGRGAALNKFGGARARGGGGAGKDGSWRDEDGWAQVKVKGRGRGRGRGQGQGQGQSRGTRGRGRGGVYGNGNGGRGGSGGGGWV